MAQLKEGVNKVIIKGMLVDNSLDTRVSRDGKPYIGGNLIIAAGENNQVPVNFFAFQKRKDGEYNKIYTSLESVMNHYKSIAAVGKENADYVAITNGNLEENAFYVTRGGDELRLISSFRIRSNFVNREKTAVEPQSTFEVETFIKGISEEAHPDDETKSRLVIVGLAPNFFGRVHSLKFYVDEDKKQQYVANNYKEGDTVKLAGSVVNNVYTRTVVEEMDFGEDIERVYENSRKELIATSGSAPYIAEMAYEEEAIMEAAKEREQYLQEQKEKKENQTATSNTGKPKDDMPF